MLPPPSSQIIGGGWPPSSYAYDYGNKPVNLKIIIKKNSRAKVFRVLL